jgi:hypothetical protein
LQNVPRQHIEIELGRNVKMAGIREDGVDQAWIIKDRISRFGVGQKIDQGNMIVLRTPQRAHDEIEIGGGKARPTIRPDHRELIMRDARAYGKSDSNAAVHDQNIGILPVRMRVSSL